MARTATKVMHNAETNNVWLQPVEGECTHLGFAQTRDEALDLIGRAGIVRTGNWLPEYGPVKSVTVRP